MLKANAPGRIVNVSSLAHAFMSELDLDDLNFENKPYRNTYAQSKLCNILFTLELAKRLEGTGIKKGRV